MEQIAQLVEAQYEFIQSELQRLYDYKHRLHLVK